MKPPTTTLGSGGIARGWLDKAATNAIHEHLTAGVSPSDFGPRWLRERVARLLRPKWKKLRGPF